LQRSYKNETGGHGGDLAAALEYWDPAAGEFIDFSSNINPLGPPDGLIGHLEAALPDLVSYPTPQARELRRNLAVFLNLQEESLLLGNGANELIHFLMLWLRPRRVILPVPSFSEYERAARLAGAMVERFPLPPGEEIDSSKLIGQLSQGDLLVFCNPNNPTGKLFGRKELLVLADAAEKRGALMLLDESFIPLTGRSEESLRDLPLNNLWIVMSLTKIWGLPGLRLGCMVGPGDQISEISRWGDPWRVNFLAQKAGLFCLGQQSYIEKTLSFISRERDYLKANLGRTGFFQVFEGAANFLLVKGLEPAFQVEQFQADQARKGLLIRRADNFPGLDHRYFRIAVRKRPENKRLMVEINNWLRNNSLKKNDSVKRGEEL
jgi:threonine-phosphate decarboxylase